MDNIELAESPLQMTPLSGGLSIRDPCEIHRNIQNHFEYDFQARRLVDLEMRALRDELHMLRKSVWNEYMSSDLIEACLRSASSGVVNRILQEGANVNYIDQFGKNALAVSIQNNRLDIVKLLIQNGAKVNHFGSERNTSLHVYFMPLNQSQADDYKEIIKFLYKNNAYINAQNTQGYTPLTKIIYQEVNSKILISQYSYDLVKFYISHGADLSVNIEGMSIMSYMGSKLYRDNIELGGEVSKIIHILHYADKACGMNNFPEYTDEKINQITGTIYDEEIMSLEIINWYPPLVSINPFNMQEGRVPFEAIKNRCNNFLAVSGLITRSFGLKSLGYAAQHLVSFLKIDDYHNLIKAILETPAKASEKGYGIEDANELNQDGSCLAISEDSNAFYELALTGDEN
ncbi:MAG: ankyrin repeat domain-containing protein [Rickettsiaceae bacterium]|nr:ankyrin repeat domain-containing protein [Rickettsiaceae bacterium]